MGQIDRKASEEEAEDTPKVATNTGAHKEEHFQSQGRLLWYLQQPLSNQLLQELHRWEAAPGSRLQIQKEGALIYKKVGCPSPDVSFTPCL